MSADLLAAFGEQSDTAQPNQSPQQPRRENDRASRFFDSDDTRGAWGSFLSTSREARAASKNNSERNSRSYTPVPEVEPAQIASVSPSKGLWREEGGMDVLFDAATEDVTNDDDTDDWGEFETANPPGADTNNGNAGDLLDWDTGNNTASNTALHAIEGATEKFQQQSLFDLFPSNARTDDKNTTEVIAPDISPWGKDWTKFEESICSNVVPSKPEQSDDDDWGDFKNAALTEDTTPTTRMEPPRPIAHPIEVMKPETREPICPQIPIPSTAPTKSNTFQHRPMNIPPPSILLSLFPPLLEQYYQKVVKCKKTESKDTKLASSLEVDLKVMARILAGRTLRWKRDTVLSQSMKIGPASGKAGGMKLNSVNKNEDVKEEKEAVEVLEAWRKRSSYLNSFILSAGGRAVPVLPNNVQVKTGTVEEDGAFKAPHPCGLCGVKRDERIPKIDGIVHDNFGEWWIELWGHTDCRNFWEANCDRLNQR
ncbi:hypothetical protein ACJ73_08323 [Blastomyces percursus]|uniref:Uncharacterized protein n=1 Tax=Blastomyces percursus TaxID=1658174 RepID=A0A1J9PVD3_9EURO|nr:hypothetical protein ACJ73_08323 [Blastomyces percursus]